jgi:hypothetical protein
MFPEEEVATLLLHGVIRTGELKENPPESGQIELVVRVQGVGPSQPRLLVIPFSLLLEEASLDPENVAGRGFEAEVEADEDGRWVVRRIALAAKVLRPGQ